jgi:hypothetical protein
MCAMGAVPQKHIPYVQISLSIALYMNILLLVDGSGLSPNSQYIFSVIPSLFCFKNMYLS